MTRGQHFILKTCFGRLYCITYINPSSIIPLHTHLRAYPSPYKVKELGTSTNCSVIRVIYFPFFVPSLGLRPSPEPILGPRIHSLKICEGEGGGGKREKKGLRPCYLSGRLTPGQVYEETVCVTPLPSCHTRAGMVWCGEVMEEVRVVVEAVG